MSPWSTYVDREARLQAEVKESRVVLACPSGCPCVFPDDPDQFECACDGLCISEEWNDLRQSLEDARSALSQETVK